MRRLLSTFLLLLCASFTPGQAQELYADLDATPQASEAPVAAVLRAEALDWADTPHILGGESRRGIDCSGLMQTWYDDLFAIDLPRTSREQYQSGTPVERDDLQPGDLVFFGSARRITHVGAYVGNGEFAHVASSVGVTVSRLDESYWKRRYRGARRVMDASTSAPPFVFAAAETPVPPPSDAPVESQRGTASEAPTFTRASLRGSAPAASTRRVGW